MSDVSHIAEPLRQLAVPIAGLVEMPNNPRRHNTKNLTYIRGSVERFQQVRPLVLAADGKTVIAGNGTLAAMRAAGYTMAAVVRSDLEGGEAEAFAVADNYATDLSEFDVSAVLDIAGDMDRSMAELTRVTDILPGFTLPGLPSVPAPSPGTGVSVGGPVLSPATFPTPSAPSSGPSGAPTAPAASPAPTDAGAFNGVSPVAGLTGGFADVTLKFGQHSFVIEHKDYEPWREELRQTVGFEETPVVAEIRRRLGL